jgi:hypothetical protein
MDMIFRIVCFIVVVVRSARRLGFDFAGKLVRGAYLVGERQVCVCVYVCVCMYVCMYMCVVCVFVILCDVYDTLFYNRCDSVQEI